MGRNAGSAGRGNGGRGARRSGAAAGSVAPEAVAPATVALAEAAPPQTAGLLEPSERTERYSTYFSGYVTDYKFRTSDGDMVQMTIAQTGKNAEIAFAVNNSTEMAYLPQDMANAVSMRLMRHIRDDAKTRPEGFGYHAHAATIDGDANAQRRAVAYQAIGMTRPVAGVAGGEQFGVVVNGRIKPDTARLEVEELPSQRANYNQRWQDSVDAFRGERNRNR